MSGTEDGPYAASPDNSYTVRIKELIRKIPELEPVVKGKTGSMFKADEEGNLVLCGVDKELKDIPVKLFAKQKYVASPGTWVIITADVNDMRTFFKKKQKL